jgi:hypothetical protein
MCCAEAKGVDYTPITLSIGSMPPLPYSPLGRGNPNKKYFTNDNVTSLFLAWVRLGKDCRFTNETLKHLPTYIFHGSMYIITE